MLANHLEEILVIDENIVPDALHKQTVLALNKLGRKVTSSLELEDVLQRIMCEVTELMDAEGVAVIMPYAEDSMKFVAVSGAAAARLKGAIIPAATSVAGYVMRTGEAVWIDGENSVPGVPRIVNLAANANLFHARSLLAAPLILEGRTIGVLEAARHDCGVLTVDDLPALVMAANWAAIAISNAQLHKQAQTLLAEQALFEERTRLAHELHDVVSQSLYSMSMLIGAWRRQIEAGRLQPLVEHIVEIDELLRQAMGEVRLLVYELRPTELEEEGFIGAVRRRLDAVEKRTGIATQLVLIDEWERRHELLAGDSAALIRFGHVPRDIEFGLYRITQEALNNILKHSEATAVAIDVQLNEEQLSVEIRDNGRGFAVDSPEFTRGFGLLGLQERASQMGGSLSIKSAPGAGTAISIRGIPYRKQGSQEIEL